MENETDEDKINKARKKINKVIVGPLTYLWALAIITTLTSPIFWIWHSFALAWRVGLTALIISLIVGLIRWVIVKASVNITIVK